MQRDIRLIGLDLDFTTLNEKKEITPCVAAAIGEAIAAGIAVLPATGRALEGVPREFLDIPGVRYALCSNGAKIYDLQENRVVYSNCFTKQTALDVLDVCDEVNAVAALFLGGKVYSGPYDVEELRRHYSEETVRYFQQSRRPVPDLRQLIRESDEEPEKYSLTFYDMDDRARAKVAFGGNAAYTVTSSIPGNLEVNAAGVNKGLALLRLGEILGYTRAQVMAVGDGTNDLEMLREVGYAVAMANAHAEVLKVADWVTTSCEEDGVAVAIRSVMPKNQHS